LLFQKKKKNKESRENFEGFSLVKVSWYVAYLPFGFPRNFYTAMRGKNSQKHPQKFN